MSKVSKQNVLQPTYRKCHSTETVNFRFHHDIAVALENNICEILMLDISAAFDVLNHGYLHKRLQYIFSIMNDAFFVDLKNTTCIN